MSNMNLKRFIQYGIVVAFLCLFVIHFKEILGWGNNILAVAFPLTLGCVFAYVLNILMVRLEKIYFPKSSNPMIEKSRRPVCMVFSLALLILIIIFVLYLVIPEVVNCFVVISKDVPEAFQKALEFLIEKSDELPVLQKQLTQLDLDWGNLIKKVSQGIMAGSKGILTSATTIVGSFVGMIANVVVGLIFSMYILACKEDVKEKINRVFKAFMKTSLYEKVIYVLKVLDESFSNFIVGQATEAVILGSLCAIGMSLLQLPYAVSIGALVGLTALIPIFGAYIGAVLGAFMIVTIEPKQALVFLIFLLILQQVEGNLIYPRVVGSSIGLPGIWVLAAIMIGSGLGGVVGMLIGVPIAASAYKLVRDMTKQKEENGQFADSIKPV